MEALRPQRDTQGADRVQRQASRSVSTSARLHFGFLDPSGRGPRPSAGSGSRSTGRRTRLELCRAATSLQVSGLECERAERYLRRSPRASASKRTYALQSTRRSRRMRGSARARSLRLPSAPPSRRWKACRSTSARSPRGSGGARGQASASARSSKAARCSTSGPRDGRCRVLVAASPSRALGACC